ncbi:MAG TPA: insulinase family protein, partial [Candidatus Polarisedimenticolia bacterium]|nr:insulinase family protein [Candidatus Polarisedimenticolia bacterium]
MSRPGIRPAAVTAAFGAALALACAAVPEAVLAAAAAPAKPVLERSVLKNGLTSYRLERAGLPLVQMQLLIPAGGTADPAGKEGLAALTARLLSRGSAGRTAAAFAEEVEFLGGSLQADAGLDRTLIAGEF